MSDVVAEPMPEPTSTVSQTSYDEMKKLADQAQSKLAAADAKIALYEQRDRAQLQSFQPNMQAMLSDLASEFGTPDNKSHFDSMADWARTCHERPNLDSQLQLGTVIHSAASALKRSREQASVQSATAEQLASALKENESLKEERTAKDARIGELSNSLKEITDNHNKLQTELQKAGLIKEQEKFDFSKAASREVDAPRTVGNVEVKTENASKGFVAPQDPTDALMAFITSTSTQADSRFMPAFNSNHSILGATSADAGIAANIRPM